METERKIKILNSLEEITVIYHEYEHDKSDNSVMLYDKFKFGIHLTDGLAAVTNEKIINADKGDIFVFSPHEIHFGRFLNPGKFRHLDFYFPLNFFDEFSEKFTDFKYIFADSSKTRQNCIRPEMEDKVKILSLSERIISLMTPPSTEKDILIFTSILEILSICSGIYPNQKNKAPAFNIPPQILDAISFIKEHFCEDISLLSTAKEINITPQDLSNIFKQNVGFNFNKYISRLRLNYSRELLLQNKHSVSEICFLCGYRDVSHFLRSFKKEFGVSPGVYRSMQNEN